MGIKDLLFEQETVSNQSQEPATIPIPVDSDPPVLSNPIDKSSPVGKLMDLIVALESTLPDRDLRYKVAMTTLQAQGIDKQLIEKDIVSSQLRLNSNQKAIEETFQNKMTEVNELKEQEKQLRDQADGLKIQIQETEMVIIKDKDTKLRNINVYRNQIDDITARIK